MILMKPMSQQWNLRAIVKNNLKQMTMKATIQNLWDAAKVVLRDKFKVIQALLKTTTTTTTKNKPRKISIK